jgi:hypothetical protein
MRNWRIAIGECAVAIALTPWPARAGGFGFRAMSVPMHIGGSHIVPPFTSFSSRPHFGRQAPFLFDGASDGSFPFPFYDSGFSGDDPSSSAPVSLNAQPAAEPPPPAAYNPPTVEMTPAGVEVVRLMSTSPRS